MSSTTRRGRYGPLKFLSAAIISTGLLTSSFVAVAGAAGTLSVTPISATVTVANSAKFATTLDATGFSGSPTFTYVATSTNPALVLNPSTGVITTSGTLAVGSYIIGGTVSDTNGDSGSWAFTLNVASQVSIVNPAVARTISTGSLDEQLYTDGTYVWVANLTTGSVSQLLETTGVVLHTIDFTSTTPGFAPSGIASNGINVWVTNFNGSSIDEFNIAQVNAQSSVNISSTSLTLVPTNTNTTVPPVGNSEPSDISFSGNTVWVTTQSGQALVQINAATGLVINTITPSSGALVNPRGVSSDGTDVWVANPGYAFGGNNNDCATTGATQWNNTVSEINATTGALVASIPVGNAYVAGTVSGSQPWDISADGTYTWVTLKCQDAVAKISSSTGAVVGYISLPSGALPEGIVSDGTNVWVSESGLSQVQEIDANSNAIVGTFTLAPGSDNWGITYDGTHVWVANFVNGTVSEIVSTPKLTPIALPVGTVGTPYNQTLTASNGAPGTYVITCSGTLPAGITATPNATGVVIAGTPTVAGTYIVAINCNVTDSTGVSSNDVIPITINPATVGPVSQPSPPPVPLTPILTVNAPILLAPTPTTVGFSGTDNPDGAAITSQAFCYIAGRTLVDCGGAKVVPITPSTLASGVTPIEVSAAIAGLAPGSPYCYQLEATSAAGTSYSVPRCFVTLAKVVTPVVVLPPSLSFITHFGENLYSLTPNDKTIIHKLALYVKAKGIVSISLTGFTDPLDSVLYNKALGERRSNSVSVQLQKDLVAIGLSKVRLITSSKGETKLVEVGLSNGARASDRRVVIAIL